jgi:hypothetical protein
MGKKVKIKNTFGIATIATTFATKRGISLGSTTLIVIRR